MPTHSESSVSLDQDPPHPIALLPQSSPTWVDEASEASLKLKQGSPGLDFYLLQFDLSNHSDLFGTIGIEDISRIYHYFYNTFYFFIQQMDGEVRIYGGDGGAAIFREVKMAYSAATQFQGWIFDEA